jgi:hypothetical protein
LRGSQDRKQRDYNAAPAWTGTRGGTGTGYFGSTTGTLVGADGKWHANPAPPRSSLRVADVVKVSAVACCRAHRCAVKSSMHHLAHECMS